MIDDPNKKGPEGEGMTEDRLIEILDAYGADPLAWPERERFEAQALTADPSSRVAAALEEAAGLDAFLSQATVPEMSEAAVAQMISDAKPGQFAKTKRLLGQIMGWSGSLWQPAGALACALFLGIGLSAVEPDVLNVGNEAAEIKTVSVTQYERSQKAEDIFGLGLGL